MESTDLPFTNIHLIGGEMLLWSDLRPTSGPGPFVGRASRELVRRLVTPGVRTVIVGPHDPGLVSVLLEEGAQASVLVRSYPDAQEISGRYAENSKLDVYCGALEKFRPDLPFQLVLVTGGLDSLSSADGVELGWRDAFDHIVGLVEPGGSLLLGVENHMGIHRLVDLQEPLSDWGDHAWSAQGSREASYPRGLDGIRQTFAAADLDTRSFYCGFPDPRRPTLAVTAAGFDEPAMQDMLTTAVTSALAHGFADRGVLSDPKTLGELALRNRLGVQLAPLWLFVLHRRAPGDQAPQDTAPIDQPAILISEDEGSDHWTVTCEVVRDDAGGWRRRPLQHGRSLQVRTLGRVLRDPQLLDSPISAGELLQDLLLDACIRQNTTEVRGLVRRYADWLTGQAVEGARPGTARKATGAAVFATLDNVVASDGELEIADPSWSLCDPVLLQVALIRALRRFASRLMIGGYRHPWPTLVDVDRLTRTLVAMSGVSAEAEHYILAARLDAEITASTHELSPVEEANLVARMLSGSPAGTGSDSQQVRGYREALAMVNRLREELRTANSHVEWLDGRLEQRERQLVKARKNLAMVRQSTSFRVGRGITAPVRLPLAKLAKFLRAQLGLGGRTTAL